MLYIFKLFSLFDTYSHHKRDVLGREESSHFLLNSKLTLINFLYISFFFMDSYFNKELVSDVYIMISIFNFSKKDLFRCHILLLLVTFYKHVPIHISKELIASSYTRVLKYPCIALWKSKAYVNELRKYILL